MYTHTARGKVSEIYKLETIEKKLFQFSTHQCKVK
jgi:hypothetical protein